MLSDWQLMRSSLVLAADCLVRTVLMVALLFIFGFFDWELAVRFIVNSAALGVIPFCQDVRIDRGIEVICNGHGVGFTKECTYIDLFLLVSPFLWRFRDPITSNIRRLIITFSAIWVLNSIRVIASVSAYSNGVHWQIAHDVPDYILYGSIMIVALISYWRQIAVEYPIWQSSSPREG